MSVARVSALTGLKDALPRSFTQISWRMCVVMGQRKPEATSPSAICRQRSDRIPFRLTDGNAATLDMLYDSGHRIAKRQ
jgi:hypothetical protein